MTAVQPIGVLGLSGNARDTAALGRALRYLEAHGRCAVMAPEAGAEVMRFAGDDQARLAALTSLLDRQEIDTIIGLRGGYGITRLLAEIDFKRVADAIDARGVKIIGQSDFTAFSLALLALTGRVSYAGPILMQLGGDAVDPLTDSRLWQAVEGRMQPLAFATPSASCGAEGVLWGGNLTVMTSLLGTPFFPRIKGGILFVEDVNEHPYRIERMLLQLLQAGVLNEQSALIVGDITNYRVYPHDGGYDLPEALAAVRKRTQLPVVEGLPFGHTGRVATIPVGAKVTLSVRDQVATIGF